MDHDELEVRRLAAFTDDPAGGNPAGVVVTPELPAPSTMQAIAAEVGYSETAFLVPGEGTDHLVRYFSPVAEVDFCGHATIAAGVALGEDRGAGTYLLHTNAGPVPVAVARRAAGHLTATLTSVEPRHRPIPPDALASTLDLFGWTTEDLDPALPAAEAFAGAWHLVLGLRDRDRLRAMTYRFDELADVMHARGLTTLQVVWRQDEVTIHARNPFPVGGVVEDPATGAAAAALGGYLRAIGLVGPPVDLTIHQGGDIGRPSVIAVHVPTAGGIDVTGTAVTDPV